MSGSVPAVGWATTPPTGIMSLDNEKILAEFRLAHSSFSYPKEHKMKKILILWVAGILLLTACAAPVSSRMVITFTVDEKCTMQGPTTIAADKVIPVDILEIR